LPARPQGPRIGGAAARGGTDLLPQLKNGLIKPTTVVDLSGVAELRVLEGDGQRGFRVGAAVTARALERDPRIVATYPALAESAALVGSIQIRNLATVGGNLCNAAPSADMAPPLVALDAEAVIASAGGRRRVPVASFFSGVRRTVLAPDELLVELVIPAPGPRSGGAYLRHTPRRELDIAVVGVASQVSLTDGVCAKAASRWPRWRRRLCAPPRRSRRSPASRSRRRRSRAQRTSPSRRPGPSAISAARRSSAVTSSAS